MELDDFTKIIKRSFEHHIDGLEVGLRHGVKVLPSDLLNNTDVTLMVSPAAYEALKKRIESKEPDDG